MEKNCIFCETPIYPDGISYKIDEHFICYRCASTQTIRSLNNVLNDELRVDPNVIDVTDSSLAGQTDSSNNNVVELDKSKLADSSLAGQTDLHNAMVKHDIIDTYSNFPVRDIDGNDIPWDDAMFTYAANEYGILGENIPAHVKVNGFFRYPGDFLENIPEYVHDAGVMSEDDYLSKYVDNNGALAYWVTAHPESIE